MTDTLAALARPALLVALAAVAASAVAAPAAKPGPVTVYVGTYTDGDEPRDLPLHLRPRHRRHDRARPRGRDEEPLVPRPPPERALPLRGGRGLELRGREDGRGERLRDRPEDGRPDAPQPAARRRARAPCHLVVDRTGRNVLVANYGGGTVAVLPIGADGRLKPRLVGARPTRAPARTRAGRRSRTPTASTSTPPSASPSRPTSGPTGSSSTASTPRRARSSPTGRPPLEPGSGPASPGVPPVREVPLRDQRAPLDGHRVLATTRQGRPRRRSRR